MKLLLQGKKTRKQVEADLGVILSEPCGMLSRGSTLSDRASWAVQQRAEARQALSPNCTTVSPGSTVTSFLAAGLYHEKSSMVPVQVLLIMLPAPQTPPPSPSLSLEMRQSHGTLAWRGLAGARSPGTVCTTLRLSPTSLVPRLGL